MENVVFITGSSCFIDYYANWAGIVQKQDLFNIFKTTFHRHMYMVSIPTFQWSRIEHMNEIIKCET